MTRKRVAILISGRGSNMAALIEAAQGARLSGRDRARGLQRSRCGRARACARGRHRHRGARSQPVRQGPRGVRAALQAILDEHRIELICLAGFMRLFTAHSSQRWHGRMLNIHPSLLPAFPGLDPHGQALRAGAKTSGATVHFVIPETDAGPIIAQESVPVLRGRYARNARRARARGRAPHLSAGAAAGGGGEGLSAAGARLCALMETVYSLPNHAERPEKDAMIDLYTWTTPNGRKASIALEELGLPYTAHAIDICKDEQFQPDFLKIAPNNRIPAIVDRDNGMTLMELGAILIYLADKTGKLLAEEGEQRYRAIEWLMWQMGGPGPMLGQVHHFVKYNKGKAPYAEERYLKEAHRLYGVLDRRLAGVSSSPTTIRLPTSRSGHGSRASSGRRST